MVYNGIVKGMGNMKKLYANFTKEEKALLKQIFKEINIKDVTIVNHARERMESKGITESDIYNCLRSFDVIELHQKDWDIRLLLRLTQVFLPIVSFALPLSNNLISQSFWCNSITSKLLKQL